MNERLFSPLRDEPVDQAALRRVRTEVLARLGRSRPGGRVRLAWVAAVVAAVVWAGQLMIPPAPDGSGLEVAVLAHLPKPPSAQAPVPTTRREEAKTASPLSPPVEYPLVEQVRVNPAPPDDETGPDGVILKLASSNPDVILYWLMDGQGD